MTLLLCRVKDQQLQDVNHQLQTMLDENQHLRVGRRPKPSQEAPASMDSSAVIEHRLLPFKDIKVSLGVPQEMQASFRLKQGNKCTIFFL